MERGQRFHGLTPNGERVLKWANAILDNWTSLQQEIATLRNSSGTLTYRERYCLLVRTDHELAKAPSVSCAEAAKQPICLLTSDMQNRRIIDRAFREANSAPIPRLETNSVINLCANVRLMGLASIILEYFLDVLGPISDVRAVPLTEPLVEHNVGLVAVDRDPISPLVLAAFECAKQTEPPAKSRRK